MCLCVWVYFISVKTLVLRLLMCIASYESLLGAVWRQPLTDSGGSDSGDLRWSLKFSGGANATE